MEYYVSNVKNPNFKLKWKEHSSISYHAFERQWFYFLWYNMWDFHLKDIISWNHIGFVHKQTLQTKETSTLGFDKFLI